MWRPVSKVDYTPLEPKGQILVVSCPLSPRWPGVLERWKGRACAAVGDSAKFVRDVVRDILANPQVRAIVFDGEACGRAEYDAFWSGSPRPAWRIDDEHLTLVRQFVDLYDDDCGMRVGAQPFWPTRVMYIEDLEVL
jgi:hypothetical protein